MQILVSFFFQIQIIPTQYLLYVIRHNFSSLSLLDTHNM